MNETNSNSYDVLVVGGGQAGLTAAITAAELGASVCVLEAAAISHRGGNSRHTRNLRAMHEAPTSVLTDAYLEDEYWEDLLRVIKGVTTEHLARLTIQKSAESTEGCNLRAFTSSPLFKAHCISGGQTPFSWAAAKR